MTLRTFANAVGGGSGNGTSIPFEGGQLFLVITAGSSFASTTMTVQWSDDGTTWYTITSDASLATSDVFFIDMPSGFVRLNFTGGAGTGITVKGKSVVNRRLTDGVSVGSRYTSNTVTNS